MEGILTLSCPAGQVLCHREAGGLGQAAKGAPHSPMFPDLKFPPASLSGIFLAVSSVHRRLINSLACVKLEAVFQSVPRS